MRQEDGSRSPERQCVCAENRDEGVNPVLNPHDLSLLNCHLKIPFSDRIQFNKLNACRYLYRGGWFWVWVSGQTEGWKMDRLLIRQRMQKAKILSLQPLTRNESCDCIHQSTSL